MSNTKLKIAFFRRNLKDFHTTQFKIKHDEIGIIKDKKIYSMRRKFNLVKVSFLTKIQSPVSWKGMKLSAGKDPFVS